MAGSPRHGRSGDGILLVRLARGERGELQTEEIGTEVFLLPAAVHTEKDGCFTNTQRLLQFHEKAVDPRRFAKRTWFMLPPRARLKEKARRDPRPRNAGLNALDLGLFVTGSEGDAGRRGLQEING